MCDRLCKKGALCCVGTLCELRALNGRRWCLFVCRPPQNLGCRSDGVEFVVWRIMECLCGSFPSRSCLWPVGCGQRCFPVSLEAVHPGSLESNSSRARIV